MSDIQNHSSTSPPLSVQAVADLVDGRVEGDPAVLVSGIAPLDQAGEGELGFLAQRRYLKFLPETRARAILVSEALAKEAAEIPSRLVVKDPHRALAPILARFYPAPPSEPGIHPTAVLGAGVELGAEVQVGPYAVLEEGVVVGDRARIGAHTVLGAGSMVGEDSLLYPHVVLYPGTKVGARVILHSGVRLGVDGYGYVQVEGEHKKVPQVGACVVEDDVEIGANCCIDRGSIGRTVIGRGSKLDNLVHLAHNVQIGQGVLLTAMVGIAGSTRVGDGAMFGGQAGVIGHVEIGAGARLGAQAGVIGDVAPGETVSGYPARNNREYLKAMGLAFKLPETLRKLADMEGRLRALEGDDSD
ncbi:UDP-3-O-(3-hydroxymyristoyl)glucosamine N-acyltransferase [Gemmatimonadota bacterium]